MDAGRGDPVVGEHPLGVLDPGAREPLRAEGERGECGLEQDPAFLPLRDRVTLHHPFPAPHLLGEPGADPAGGVDA